MAKERLLAKDAALSCTLDSAPAKMAAALQLCAKSEPCSNMADFCQCSTGKGESPDDNAVV